MRIDCSVLWGERPLLCAFPDQLLPARPAGSDAGSWDRNYAQQGSWSGVNAQQQQQQWGDRGTWKPQQQRLGGQDDVVDVFYSPPPA